jgi:hypothetical protein
MIDRFRGEFRLGAEDRGVAKHLRPLSPTASSSEKQRRHMLIVLHSRGA